MSFFDLIRPRSTPSALLIEVPHAGLLIPEEIDMEIIATRKAALRDSDLYVDQLYENAPDFGATMLVANTSRYVVDLNRAPYDIDMDAVPKHPQAQAIPSRGVVWRATTDGTPLLKAPLRNEQFARRMELFYEPYHATLRKTAQQICAEHGHVLILAAHSMPSRGRGGSSKGYVSRADVVPGTRGRTTADGRMIDLIDAHFRDAGLSVQHDLPYRGGWTSAHYGAPERGCHVVQIELNRGLYVDESSSDPKKEGFALLKEVLAALAEKLRVELPHFKSKEY